MFSSAFHKPAGFRLRAASDFYATYPPGWGMAAAANDQLTFSFGLDGSFTPVVVTLREEPQALRFEFTGTADVGAVERQIRRMLGLDRETSAWFELGERDLVVGELQRQFPGFLFAA